jgi:HEAT repeat protein
LGCTATSWFTRKHYYKSPIDSTATALAAIRESDDPVLRREAFEYLGDPDHVGPENVDEVTGVLGLALGAEPRAQTKIAILHSLAQLGSAKRLDTIAAALKDSDPAVRIAACRAIGKPGNDEIAQILGELLTSDPALDVQLAAADALSNISSRQSANILLTGVAHSDVAIRHRCRQSLRQILGKDHAGNVNDWQQEIQTASFEEGGHPRRFWGRSR